MRRLTRCLGLRLGSRLRLFSTRSTARRAGRHQTEIEFSSIDVDERNLDSDFVAQSQLRVGAAADEADARGVEVEVVLLGQRADVDEAVHRHLHSFAKEAEAFDAGDNRVELVADTLGHERQQLDLGQLTLGLSRSAFGVRTMRAEDFEFRVAHAPRRLAGAEIIEQPMNRQVRVTADRTREVTVLTHRQCVMPDRHAGVFRLPQTAEQGVIDRVLGRSAGDILEQLLQRGFRKNDRAVERRRP